MASTEAGSGPKPPGRVSRRSFLVGLGAVGGAGAVLGALEAMQLVARPERQVFTAPAPSDFTLQGRANGTRVLVLGAGIAGLTAAYELEKGGYAVEVIEARDRPGGRSWTLRGGDTVTELDGTTQAVAFADGLYMNAGPARIPQHHTTMEYCRELGVAIEPFANVNADAWYFHEGSGPFDSPGVGERIRIRAARADLYGYVSELLAKAVDQGALERVLDARDAEMLVEFLRQFGALGPDDRYVGTTRRGFDVAPAAGTVAGTPAAAMSLSDVLQAGFGFHFPFELEWDQAMMMFQPVGGMDRIPVALAAAVNGTIRYRCEVREIRSTDSAVEVVFKDGAGEGRKVEADYCVCTIPPMVLARIPNSFSDQANGAISSLQGLPTAKLGLQYRRRFWELDESIYGGITTTDMDINTIWYPSSGYLGERGVLIGYYNFGAPAETFGALRPESRIERAIVQGRKVHGDAYAEDFETGVSVHWAAIPFSEGGWVNWGGPPGGAYDTLLQPQGRVYFAGDHLSHMTAWQHGAFESARHAVMALHQRVLGA